MAGRGHDDHEGLHGDWWSSLRAPRRFRRGADDDARVATLPDPPAGADIDEDVAELRAVRARLARELSIMDERVGHLARVKAERERANAAPADIERMAAVQAKLRRAAEALEDAHRVREALAGHMVAREHEALVASDAGAEHRPRRLVPLFLALVAALVAGLALGAALLGGSDDPPPRAAAPAPPAAAAPPTRCADLGPAGGSCITGTALTIAAQDRPLVMRELEARVTDVTRNPTGVDVRLRLTNRTGETQSLARRIYLSLNGQRVYAQADPLPARVKRPLVLSFALPVPPPERADLGVVPFGERVDAARRLGVIRLTLPPA